jgi:hypothetical protein
MFVFCVYLLLLLLLVQLLVCGQALSHCVNMTVRDIVDHWKQSGHHKDELHRIYILEDGALYLFVLFNNECMTCTELLSFHEKLHFVLACLKILLFSKTQHIVYILLTMMFCAETVATAANGRIKSCGHAREY